MPRIAAHACLAVLALAAGTTASAAPPSLVLTGQLGTDLSADGQTVVGAPYNAALSGNVVYSYTVGVGPWSSDEITFASGSVRCSGDGSIVHFRAKDAENLAGLGTDKLTPHLWRPFAGTVTNLGKPPFGFNCDAFMNSITDMARDGLYACGAGYTQSTCGPLRAQRYDIQTDTWEILPVSISPPPLSVPASHTNSWGISADGNVIIGYDENYDSTFTQKFRGSAVWVRSGGAWTQTVLDRYYYGVKAVSADGNTIIGYMSQQKMQSTFGTTEQKPIRWTRSGNNWVPQILGGSGGQVPLLVSANGSTIAGSGGPSSSWIWHTGDETLTPLDDYVSSLGGSFPGLEFASGVGDPIYAISDDGNAILLSTVNTLNCLTWFPGAVLYLNGAPCEPANIVVNPVSHYNPSGPIDEPGGMIFNCPAAGSWPMSFQWQKETEPGSDVWVDLTDDNCPAHIPDDFNYRGTTTMQLRLGGLDDIWAGYYRCVVTNDCGSATSLTFRAATCFADFDCNGFVNGDDFDTFVVLFEAGNPDSDVDGNGFPNGDDFDAFAAAFIAGC